MHGVAGVDGTARPVAERAPPSPVAVEAPRAPRAGAGERHQVGPPRLPFGLAVGITGHRIEGVGRAGFAAVRAEVETVLRTLAATGRAIREREAEFFASSPPSFRFISPLADGADQLGAELALAAGYELEAVLPFERDHYCEDFNDPDVCDRYHALLRRARSVLELPGERARATDAYVAAGRATVAQSDLLIALWNGQSARGRGGTAEIVEHALRRGLPVIHIGLGVDRPTRILWTGYNDPPMEVLDFCDAPERRFNAATAEALLTEMLAPPAEPAERGFIAGYYREREVRLRTRMEYPLLLALFGVKRFSRAAMRVRPFSEATRAEWAGFHAGCANDLHVVSGGFLPLEAAYCWGDKLAEHYALSYRSGHVLNFVLAATAVLLALSGLVFPDAKFWLVAAELAVILLLVTNTKVGTRRGWHRRWLDYRHLAEQLRPMRSMKLLAIARPPLPARSGRRRWIDWYAAGFWRHMGSPSGRLDKARLERLCKLIVAEELDPQVAYHRANAERMHRLEHRLHRIADVLFVLTIVSLVVFMVGYKLFHDAFAARGALLAAITAGLPAVGAALHGIREQGEFVRTSHRSAATAAALAKVAGDLGSGGVSLARANSLAEEGARIMLADVGEWRMAYEMRKLTLPA